MQLITEFLSWLRPRPADTPKAEAQTTFAPAGAMRRGSLCIVLNVAPGDRASVLAALGKSHVEAVEMSSDGLDAVVARHRPDMIIAGYAQRRDLDTDLQCLARADYRGSVQPIASAEAGVPSPSLVPEEMPGQMRLLPSLTSPVIEAALREILLEEGVARTAEGAVAVSLEVAFKNDWIEFWYQPQIDLRRKLLVGVETLARLRHPVHGVLLPGSFLARASEADYRRLGFASMRAAIRDWPNFHRRGFNLLFAVNMPLSTLGLPQLLDQIALMLPHHQAWPGLKIEMEAREVIAGGRPLKAFFEEARRFNIHLCVENFGYGHPTSYDFLSLPIAEFKLHRFLTQGIAGDMSKAVVAKTVVDIAATHGAMPVAAGIETVEDLKAVSKLGFQVVQGNLLSPPLDRDRFIALLADRKGRQVQQGADAVAS